MWTSLALMRAMREDSNPLMYEISLARGFKLAAWARPDAATHGRRWLVSASGL
jgi:hypothetical protein